MKRMAVSSVFVSGLGGTGVEVAKNVALAGVRLLQVNDHRVANHFDLGAQYYVRESEIGKNLAQVCEPSLLWKSESSMVFLVVVLSRFPRGVFSLSLSLSLSGVCSRSLRLCQMLLAHDWFLDHHVWVWVCVCVCVFCATPTSTNHPFPPPPSSTIHHPPPSPHHHHLNHHSLQVSAPHLAELNPYTKVQCSELDLASVNLAVLDRFRCVVVCDCDEVTAVRVNSYCHERNIPFLWAVQRGLFCAGFADFGSSFTVNDRNGEPASESLVGAMRPENPLVVECLEHHRHGLETGDTVTFREVRGPDLNGKRFEVTVLSPFSFSVPFDGSEAPAYQVGRGIVEEVKVPQERTYRTLAEQLGAPDLLMGDLCKFEAPAQLHVAFRALHAFVAREKRLPAVWERADADAVLALASELNAALTTPLDIVNGELVRALAHTACACVVPLSGFLGGFMAQEVLKALSGKFSPLNGFVYLDAIELLPAGKADCTPKQTRYDSQLVAFGDQVTAQLRALRLFVVGSGAIGCELLKNFAMMGVSTAGEGQIVVTDDDIIELSNLNRQFLFREPDVGKHKSECAARAVKHMNAEVRVRALQNRIEPKTVDVFSDQFFCSRDVIVNALDSVPARLYVDQRCVTNHRPLLESGTMGAKGHVQVIIPFKTENYGSQRDPEAGGIPFCTLKSFPFKYEHCVQWARALAFEKYFVSLPQQYHKFFFETADLTQQLDGAGVRELKPHVIHRMLRRQPKSFRDCVQLARFKWERYFNHAPRHLLNAFPEDHTLPDGKPFWSSPKRRPTPLTFDVADDGMRAGV
jgi:ubiquitin-activating enzyme E1